MRAREDEMVWNGKTVNGIAQIDAIHFFNTYVVICPASLIPFQLFPNIPNFSFEYHPLQALEQVMSATSLNLSGLRVFSRVSRTFMH